MRMHLLQAEAFCIAGTANALEDCFHSNLDNKGDIIHPSACCLCFCSTPDWQILSNDVTNMGVHSLLKASGRKCGQ